MNFRFFVEKSARTYWYFNIAVSFHLINSLLYRRRRQLEWYDRSLNISYSQRAWLLISIDRSISISRYDISRFHLYVESARKSTRIKSSRSFSLKVSFIISDLIEQQKFFVITFTSICKSLIRVLCE